jgi:hypothetical protein
VLGTQAIIATQQQHTLASGLREAAFWAAFRQEIYASTMTHRPPRLSIDSAILEHSFGPADDWVWSRRCIAHCGNVLKFAYGPDSSSSYWYQKLLDDNDRWEEKRPSSFDAYYTSDDNPIQDMFPDIRYQAEWHGKGTKVEQKQILTSHSHGVAVPHPRAFATRDS